MSGWDVINQCYGGDCTWTYWDEDPGEGGGGGGVQTFPLGEDPEPQIFDLDTNCGVIRLSVPWEFGGGHFTFQMCRVGDDFEPLPGSCRDFPLYGDPGC